MITATAVAHCKAGRGLVKVNGSPLKLVKPEILRFKVRPIFISSLYTPSSQPSTSAFDHQANLHFPLRSMNPSS
jgi:hypothetical protein